MDILSSLNPEQKKAVITTEGPLLILAGPGSGKTKTLTHRIAYLVEKGTAPWNILAVTFTNKAAGEMKERVASLLAQPTTYNLQPTTSPLIGTFHSVCVRMLRENATILGCGPNFVIYDDSDQLSVIKKVMKDLDLDPKETAPRKFLSAISQAKDDLKTPEEYSASADTPHELKAAEVYKLYQERLEKGNGFDFGDLIMRSVLLLQTNKDVLEKYRSRFKYIMVDEYQDTNTSQGEWLRLLADSHRNICVVGDDAQAIYSWRNAKIEYILNFQKQWPGASIIKLEKNYRSTKKIVQAASHFISHNMSGYPKNLWTDNKEGESIVVKETANEYEEASHILKNIERLKEQESYSLNDFVVLYRTNAQSRAIEEVFMQEDVPYKIVGGTKFYQRQEVKDMVAWLRLVHNPLDTVSFDRLEKLNLGLLSARMMEKPRRKKDAIAMLLEDFSKKSKEQGISLTDLVKYIVQKSNFEKILRDGTEKGEERWMNIQELLSVAEKYKKDNIGESISSFLEDVTLAQEADNVEHGSDLVHLMTLHMAKGLEFPVVFIAGCEEGLLPHSSSSMDFNELEEERRLMYVGITRAKERAYLFFARQRTVWGLAQNNPPSSFLAGLPEECVEFEPLEREREYLIDEDRDFLDEDDEIEVW
ncbi:MAG: UvrD-helicase domain-containing protein [Candidatus Spechtbacterales bacterium]